MNCTALSYTQAGAHQEHIQFEMQSPWQLNKHLNVIFTNLLDIYNHHLIVVTIIQLAPHPIKHNILPQVVNIRINLLAPPSRPNLPTSDGPRILRRVDGEFQNVLAFNHIPSPFLPFWSLFPPVKAPNVPVVGHIQILAAAYIAA